VTEPEVEGAKGVVVLAAIAFIYGSSGGCRYSVQITHRWERRGMVVMKARSTMIGYSHGWVGLQGSVS
jgi:hypothetical protein